MRPHMPPPAASTVRDDTPASTKTPLAVAAEFLGRLPPSSTILVAVSGGSDSIGLLLALHAANAADPSNAGHRLVACTIDHALRPGSAAECDAVAARCQALGIPHHATRWSHSGVASALQERARLARYRLLSEVARTVSADLAVTGHTADDQAETVAMRAARVSRHRATTGDCTPAVHGLAGMADAMLFDRGLWVFRPFLDMARADIRAWLRSHGEPWVDDPSNADPRFERVRIRQASGQRGVDPSAQAQRRESARIMVERLGRHVRVHDALVAEIDGAAVTDDPYTRRLLSILAATLGGRAHGMAGETADRLMNVLARGSPGASTASRTVFERRQGRLFLYREWRDLPVLTLAPGETALWDGRFRIASHGSENVLVSPFGALRAREKPAEACASPLVARLVGHGVPPGVAARVARAAPFASGESVTITPVIAPYDTFLPRFDLMIAQCVAALFGCAPYPALPAVDKDECPPAGPVEDVSTK
jgi:tRNA(Ile)-lysidine synthase